MEKIYVWFIPIKNKYYYKVCKGTYKNYKINDCNQYGHELCLIIDLNYFLTHKNNSKVVSYKKMLINDIIRFLEKIK